MNISLNKLNLKNVMIASLLITGIGASAVHADHITTNSTKTISNGSTSGGGHVTSLDGNISVTAAHYSGSAFDAMVKKDTRLAPDLVVHRDTLSNGEVNYNYLTGKGTGSFYPFITGNQRPYNASGKISITTNH